MQTRKLTLTALMTAVAVVLLYIASLLPTARLAFAAAAGLAVAACVIESGLSWGLACWIISAALALFLVPDKGNGLIFAVFFGLYPILKSLFERLKSRPLEWILKFLVFNGALGLCVLAWRLGFLQAELPDTWIKWLLIPAANLVFLIYDLGFSRLIGFYIVRVASKRGRK